MEKMAYGKNFGVWFFQIRGQKGESSGSLLFI